MDIRQAKRMATDLMNKHGLSTKGWRFRFDNAKVRFGSCNYTDKEITLSKPLCELNSEKEVLDTILHEIAHALCPGQNHNKVWQRKAIEIGCSGNRCYSSSNVIQPKLKYTAVCVGCKSEYSKSRIARRNCSCAKCSGDKYNPNFKLVFQANY